LEFEPFSRLLEKAFSQDSFIAPLYRRFGGPFWESLEMWVMPPKVDLKDYKNFLTRLYSMRRKAIKHKLPEEVLLELSIDPMCRVESLDPEKLLLIYNIQQKVRGDKR